MKDLKSAIKNCIQRSAPVRLNGQEKYVMISKKVLDILLAEYNIYFVEADDTQLEYPD